MSADMLIIALPLLALVLAVLAIGGLWLWWSSSREEGPVQDAAGDEQARRDPDLPQPFERLLEETPGDSPVSRTAADAPRDWPSAVPSQSAGEAEVLRVLRDPSDGSLIVEFEGQRYRGLHEISDPQIGRRFLGSAQALARFARLDQINVPASWVDPLPPAAEAPSPALAPPVEAAPPPPPVPVPPTLRSRQASSSEVTSPRGGLFQRGKPEASEPVAALSMAEEIEELLQYRLTLSPELSQRSVHIRSTIDGGVRIEVDGRSYDGVGEIGDPAVQEIIQAAIREWEARQ